MPHPAMNRAILNDHTSHTKALAKPPTARTEIVRNKPR